MNSNEKVYLGFAIFFAVLAAAENVMIAKLITLGREILADWQRDLEAIRDDEAEVADRVYPKS